MPFDVTAVRAQFPILSQQVHGQPLVYLDNAATTQKPESVIDAIANYYRFDNANVHRGAHALSDRATEVFEGARLKVAKFIGAPSKDEVLWTRGTTESINLVAASWGEANLEAGDRILVSAMEHHSNIVPWQLIAARKGAKVEAIPVSDEGDINLAAFADLLDSRVKMVSLAHVSNALGTINPIERVIELAHAVGAKVMIDAAQSIAHWPVDVAALDCDFLAFSSHKMFGPTGMGVLYGKRALLENMPPYQGGGEMIETVSFNGTRFNQLPYKFEAGTPNIAGAVGLGAAVYFLQQLDRQGADSHEQSLLQLAEASLAELGGFRQVGQASRRVAVLSFVCDFAHPQDVGMILDQQGIAVRTGNHCAQPIMDQFGLPGTVRASLSLYNTQDDIERLMAGLAKAKMFL